MADDPAARRPDLQGVRRMGTVRWFKNDRGDGRITADAGDVLLVSFLGDPDGYRELEAGQRVSFLWNGHLADHGRHTAEFVRPEPPGS
jgi:cold shock CspA family protein